MVAENSSKRALSEDEEIETGVSKRPCTEEQNILRVKVVLLSYFKSKVRSVLSQGQLFWHYDFV